MSDYISQAEPGRVHPVHTVDVPPHTVILTCGPSGCGKSWFTEHVLLAQLRGLPPVAGRHSVHAVHLSSDDCRRELLGEADHKYAPRMMTVSAQAFALLRAKLRALTTFPVNAEFIVVDTKGLSPQLLAEVAKVVKENHYGVMALVFQYKDANSYRNLLPPGTPTDVRRSVEADAGKVFKTIRGDLRKAGITNQVAVTGRDTFGDFRFTSADHALLRRCTLSPGEEPLLIGDVHGCFDELRALLEKAGMALNDHLRIVENRFNRRVVLAGDFVDKGPDPLQVLRFIDANRRNGGVLTLRGNHEHRLFRELTGELPHVDDPRFGYTTFDLLQADEGLKRLFVEELFPDTLPFVRSDRWVCTHAPCAPRYLGKVDAKSQRAQRYLAYDLSDAEQLTDVLGDVLELGTDLCHVTHLFGHVACATPGKWVRGRIPLDGGCAQGGQLFAAAIADRAWSFSVPSARTDTPEPLLPMTTKRRAAIPAQVDPEDVELATRLAAGGANFVSGTMAPADKSDRALETVANALDRFKRAGAERVVIQPKYMGSRVNVYLAADNASSWVTSRGGFRVDDRLDCTTVLDALRARLAEAAPALLPDGAHVRMVIVDAELLPWHALGSELIADLRRYLAAYRCEHAAAEAAGFSAALADLRARMDASGYAEDAGRLSGRELSAKYGHAHRVFGGLAGLEPQPTAAQRAEFADVLDLQLARFGRPGPLELKPFGLLKVVYADGREVVPYLEPLEVNGAPLDNAAVFNILNPDGCLTVDVDDVAAAEAEFARITGDLGMEGVVIKPLALDHPGLPYLKVRSASYLTIVYGADYLHPAKHAKLLQRRSTGAKRELSLKEWRIGLECLRTPVDRLTEPEHVHRLAAFIGAQRREQGLDPRL